MNNLWGQLLIPCDSSREVGGRCYLYRIAPNDANHHPSSSPPLFFFNLSETSYWHHKLWIGSWIYSWGLVSIVKFCSPNFSLFIQRGGELNIEHRVWRAACKDLHFEVHNTEQLPDDENRGDPRDEVTSRTSCPQGVPSLVKETDLYTGYYNPVGWTL